MMMKWILILSFLILGSLADLGHFATVAADKEPPIGDGLTEDENEKNVINVLTRKLDDGESRGEEFCRSVLDTGSEVSIMISFKDIYCLLYTSPSPRDATLSRMPSSA